MMIRAHMRGIAEVDLSLFPLRQSFDPREFLLEPLLHQSFVPFQRTMQRLLASDAELSQKPPDRDQAQQDIEFIFDQRRYHLARPQRKCELELQRVLLRHRVVNPLQLPAIEFRRTPPDNWIAWPGEPLRCRGGPATIHARRLLPRQSFSTSAGPQANTSWKSAETTRSEHLDWSNSSRRSFSRAATFLTAGSEDTA